MPDEVIPWTSFENAVCDALRESLVTGVLPFDSSKAKVQRNASYLSADGSHTIKIEASIELYRENATEPFLISLWECKHKGTRKVEVGVIRELRSKIDEIGISRCSGAVVTTNGFQSGAVELAKSLGIWLFRLEDGYRLVSVTRYARHTKPELRRLIVAAYSMDDSGNTRSDVRFEELVRLHLRRTLDSPPGDRDRCAEL